MEGTEQPPHDDYVYALRDEEAYLQGDDEKPPISSEPFDDASIVCQFCGKSWRQVQGVFQAKRRVRDPNTSAIATVWICNECVAQMAQTLADEPRRQPWLLGWEVWSQRGAMRPGAERGSNRTSSGATTRATVTGNPGGGDG